MSQAEFTCAVAIQFLEEQSQPERQEFAYAYTVTIVNTGQVAAQLIARHWVITDGAGRTQEVRGLGVVGKQPLIKPGESFEYTSWTRLDTPHGVMQGTYFCMTETAEPFEASIPAFTLARQQTLH